MRDRKTYIYRLLDPRDLSVKYIGKTVNLVWRGKCHRSPQGESHCARWLKCLRRENLHAILEVVETVEAGDDWAARERYWIAYYKEQGANLCNMSAGGESWFGPRLSTETKERLRQRFLGRPIPPEQRAQISHSLAGKKQSPETVAKRLATINEHRAAQGKPLLRLGAESKLYLRKRQRERKASGRVRKFSPEWKAKIAEGMKRYHANAPESYKQTIRENGRKQGLASKGRKLGPLSAEQRAKISARLKAYHSKLVWATPTFEVVAA